MKANNVLLLAVVVIFAGFAQGCIEGHVVELPGEYPLGTGAVISATCGGAQYSGLIGSGGKFSIPVGGFTGECTFEVLETPIIRYLWPGYFPIGTSIYDCVEGCSHTVSEELSQYIGTVGYELRCHNTSCGLWCGCPRNPECDTCLRYCFDYRLCNPDWY